MNLQSDWAALTSLTSSQRLPPWMGATRTSNGAWKWNNGISVSSAYWANNEPSIYGDCATLRSNGLTACPCYSLQPAFCKMQPQLCNGGKFGGPNIQSGSISSPGYPLQYYNNLDCYYQIEGPPGTYITIRFDPFYVESYLDYVEIYEGNTTSKLIGDLDTYMPSKTGFESNSNQMLVYFHTDSMITDLGWSVQWAAKKSSSPITEMGRSGSMNSPKYPGDYDPFLEQLYYVTAPDGTRVSVTFDDFSTEQDNDFLEIYDGGSISATLIANLSGHAVAGKTLTTSGNHLAMRFITDGDMQYYGWHMTWTSS
ncbi:unnamed protein product [Cylicocyclus nassatus]|uniref:CUB domain protein n=1 Tax=Cylicocyclus nassatus TaxID=53992 RepID=A0AA36DNH9_CYLNA|nr:unnamed protein product [Cylicocyclus nassatus]